MCIIFLTDYNLPDFKILVGIAPIMKLLFPCILSVFR
jgi:hypothetical protein